jgi:hypothetical protein
MAGRQGDKLVAAGVKERIGGGLLAIADEVIE